jgi:Zn-dependent peptidase ImmA (M78 family)
MSVNGKHFIVLKKKLKGLRKAFAMFHELAHHFLHGAKESANAFYFGMIESKQEIEADAMATIALVPKFMLNSYDFLEEHPNRFARQLFRNRQKLEFLYGI